MHQKVLGIALLGIFGRTSFQPTKSPIALTGNASVALHCDDSITVTLFQPDANWTQIGYETSWDTELSLTISEA